MSTYSFDLGPINKLMTQGIPNNILSLLADKVNSGMSRRIRVGLKTVAGNKIDDNSPGWRKFKNNQNFSDKPLQMTGQMVLRSAWQIEISKDKFVLSLKSEHRGKWDNIHEIAKKTGKNWDRVWGLGELERSVIITGLIEYLEKELGVRFN